MGFLSQWDGTERIDLGDGYWVDVIKCLTAKDAQTTLDATLKVADNNDSMQVGWAYLLQIVLESVTDWNLTDSNDMLLPLQPRSARKESLERLPNWAYARIQEVVASNNGLGKEAKAEARTFPDSSVLSGAFQEV